MKKLMNAAFGMFLTALMVSAPLHGVRARVKKVEAPIERVTKGVSALEQIMDQVKLIVEFEDPTALAHAKKQLTSLMGNKALNPKIKDVIKEDIEIVEKTTESSRKAAQEAYDRLNVVAKQVEAQANVVAAIEEGAALVKNAPKDAKEEAIKTAQEKIEKAQEEQGWLQYLYTGAKRIITAPVNYVFGEESSKAKTAFYATVGAAVLAAGAYGVSSYRVTSDPMKNVNKLVRDRLESNLNEWVVLEKKAKALYEDLKELDPKNETLKEARSRADIFYDFKIVPVYEALIKSGVITVKQYNDFQESITGIRPFEWYF